jgi:hypothetical protein
MVTAEAKCMRFYDFVLKKKKGYVGEMLTSLVITAFCIIVLITGINYVATVKDYAVANQISRKYILRMETVGYLRIEDSDCLLNEMEDAGFSNVNLVGSTNTKQAFGEDVILSISFLQRGKETVLRGTGFLTVNSDKYLNIRRSSTAKG